MSLWEKNQALPIFFTAGIFSLAESGKPLQKRKFHSNTYVRTHTHTHLNVHVCALNSGYVTYSCGTCPGHTWSIQLGLYVASTSLLWKKSSVSKYFLLPSPPVTLKLGVSSAVYKCIEVFFWCIEQIYIVCLHCYFHIKSFEAMNIFWHSFSLRKEKSCCNFCLLTSRHWISLKNRKSCRLCLIKSET